MKIRLSVILIAAALTLSACGSAPESGPAATAPVETADASAVTAAPDGSSTPNAAQAGENVNFGTLTELMGKEDAELVAALGEGTPMYNDAKVLIEREYTLSLFGEEVTANISLNMYAYGDGTVEMCTLHLNNVSLDGYRDELTAQLGDPVESTDKSYKYDTDTLAIVLANPYDLPYIEISIKQ